MFAMALTRPSLTMQLTSLRGGLRACAAGKMRRLRATNVTIQPYDKRRFSSVSNVTRFLDFFLNYHKFELPNFRKVGRSGAE